MPRQRGAMESRQTDDLIRKVRVGRVVPVIGASLTYDLVFATGEKGLAQAWAEHLEFPNLERERVCRVAEYEYYRTGDDSQVKRDYLLFLKRVLLGQAKNDPRVGPELMDSSDDHTLTEIAKNLYDPQRDDPRRNPLLLLADLPLPIYVTTSFHGFLQDALRRVGKEPNTAICGWNEAAHQIVRPEHRFSSDYRPSYREPLVFHVYGHEEYPESMVLTEDNYLSFLVSIAQNVGREALDPIVPLSVLGAWATSSQLYLGFGPDTLEFRTLWMGLSSSQRKRVRGIFSLIDFSESQAIRQYVEQYLSARDLVVYWDDVNEFLSRLREA